jgi:hypothetical protein
MSIQDTAEIMELIYKHSKESNKVQFVDNLNVKNFMIELITKTG